MLTVVRRLGARMGSTRASRASVWRPRRTHSSCSPIEFSNEDIYAFERELEALHPGNRHIRDKIRQQLQVLRDRGFLLHVARNRWRIP